MFKKYLVGCDYQGKVYSIAHCSSKCLYLLFPSFPPISHALSSQEIPLQEKL